MIFETKSKQLGDIGTKFWIKIVLASNQIDSVKDRLSSIHKQDRSQKLKETMESTLKLNYYYSKSWIIVSMVLPLITLLQANKGKKLMLTKF
jgi:sterol desaturase/sphingolipid hydroxylase (fatty acid hydroxylase superfamily)